MTRGASKILPLISRPARPLGQTICRQCRADFLRRQYASAATAEAPSKSSEPQSIAPSAVPRSAYQMRAGVVLSRPPLITRDLTPFEKAFYLYQRRLNERLALPFTRYFYFRKNTPADLDWKRKVKQRQTPARDIGVYNPHSEFGWHDELKVGASESEPENQMKALLQDAIPTPAVKGTDGTEPLHTDEATEATAATIQLPPSRVTEADEQNDQKSLNRALQRSLYLLVQNAEGEWVFPSGSLVKNESLHLAAERVLVHSGGINMNTWIVGNAPIGHFEHSHEKPVPTQSGVSELGFKTFFMKARIMTGQANLQKNEFGLKDFKWLAKEEIHKIVSRQYWMSIRNMLTDR